MGKYDGYTLVFDIDGTLCPVKSKNEKYEDLIPYCNIVEKIRYYKGEGAKIVLFTSRNMNSYNGNLGLIHKNTAPILMDWLEKWEIPFDEILYGKPWPGHKGFYIDDRTVRPDEFLRYSAEELEEICDDSHLGKSAGGCMDKKLNVIITMAGAGSRFRRAGYHCPKYMIEAKGRTLFEWSLESLRGYTPIVSKYIFVVRSEDGSKGFIAEQCKELGICQYEVLELDHATDGQATTCMYAIGHCNPEEAILVYNIDTYVEPYEMKFEDISGDGHIPCFHAEGEHWSFVKVDESGKAVEVREKKRISDNCTLGAYYFSSAKLYKTIYNEYYLSDFHMEKNEKYIAPMYNYMIEKGYPVTISIVDEKKVHVLGTPDELKEFIALSSSESGNPAVSAAKPHRKNCFPQHLEEGHR